VKHFFRTVDAHSAPSMRILLSESDANFADGCMDKSMEIIFPTTERSARALLLLSPYLDDDSCADEAINHPRFSRRISHPSFAD
jgi:hypothetical protein